MPETPTDFLRFMLAKIEMLAQGVAGKSISELTTAIKERVAKVASSALTGLSAINATMKPESLTLDLSWPIAIGLHTVSQTFTKVDREEDYRRAWEVFSERYRDPSNER